MNKILDVIRDGVRSVMAVIAQVLNKISGGRITANMVTIVGLLAHIYIAWLIATENFVLGAMLLVIFGLFDTLDGQLARLQKKTSSSGMLLDATTDRMKEVLLYTGVAYVLASSPEPQTAVWAVLACGGSLLVSYTKAKGETAVKDAGLSANEINRLFQDGFMRFEIRMFILVVGLLSGYLTASLVVIAVLAWITAVQRLVTISKKL